MNSFLKEVEERFELPAQDIRTYTPLTLAFVGDNVYDLVIRTILLEEGRRKLNDIHKMKSSFVNAGTQARIAEHLMNSGILDDEEKDMYRKGRNAKTQSHAKNADLGDYHKATGLEALIGFLYLSGREERTVELIKFGLDALKEKNGEDHGST